MTDIEIMEHPDREVQSAIIRLADALCMWERGTGRKSVVIIREEDFFIRFMDGKPNVPDDISDEMLLKMVKKR